MKRQLETLAGYVADNLASSVAGDPERIAPAEKAIQAIEALRSYADALPDKPLPPDSFWRAVRVPPEAHEAGLPMTPSGMISDRLTQLYQLERPGKSLPPKHPAIILAPEDDSAVFVAIDRGKVAQVVFRNESGFLSSELIRQGMEFAWRAFPGRPLYTLIDPATTRARVPGFVFRMAGWRQVGLTPSRIKLVANPRWFEGVK